MRRTASSTLSSTPSFAADSSCAVSTALWEDADTIAPSSCPPSPDTLQDTLKKNKASPRSPVVLSKSSSFSWINAQYNSSVTFSGSFVHRFNRLAVAMMKTASQLDLIKLSPDERRSSRESLLAFLYGDYSLGKTHLLHASINEFLSCRRLSPDQIAVFTGQSFSEQAHSAFSSGEIGNFILSLSSAKALFIDDIHNVSSQPEIQDALLQVFENFDADDKPRFFTSLTPPSGLTHFAVRLTTRFQWGLLLGFEKIDRPQRLDIIFSRLQSLGISLPKAVCEHLASLDLDNLRAIDAQIHHLTHYSSVMNEEINLDMVRKFSRSSLPQIRRTITLEDIESFVMERFNVSHENMLSPKRCRQIAFPRQIAMYLSHEFTHTSMESIGVYYGGRDHSTVKHACEKIRNSLQSDPVIKSLLELFRQTFC